MGPTQDVVPCDVSPAAQDVSSKQPTTKQDMSPSNQQQSKDSGYPGDKNSGHPGKMSWYDMTTGLAGKLCEAVTSCSTCCDCWCREPEVEPRRIEIHHVTVDHCRLSSTGSSTGGRSYRERVDSANSRTDSVSSSGGLSTDSRRHVTPVIDMKPIDFWTANREVVQPRTNRRRLPSESEMSVETFQKDLYDDVTDSTCLTDEEKLAQYQLGQLHFGLSYDLNTKTLIVKIISARDLPAPVCMDDAKQDHAHSNPYCKISLLPDQKNSQQTTVQRKTQEPTWGEYFRFDIDHSEAQERTLEILIKDFDKFSRHQLIGKVLLPLSMVNLLKGGHMWKPLVEGNRECTDLGELLLSINYLPSAGRLTVDVIKAKGLVQTDMVGGSDPFVKVALVVDERPTKSRKTTCKKNTIDPVFNESVSFNVVQSQLSLVSLVVSVWSRDSKAKDSPCGRVVIGRHCTGPMAKQHWERMVTSQRSPVAQWHSLKPRPDCDQVSVASIAVP